MDILAFVDTHGFGKELNNVIKRSKEADILVCAGDITWFGKDLDKLLKKLSKIDKIILMIPGNHEEGEGLAKLCKKYKNIRYVHRKSFRLGKKVFFCWGGGGFSRRDVMFEKGMKEFKKTLRKDDEVILVTHGPPYKTKLDDLGDHVGNRSYNKAIKILKPVLYICGHLHETFKVQQVIDKTFVINPGPDGEILEV